jgi:hypothetical protein
MKKIIILILLIVAVGLSQDRTTTTKTTQQTTQVIIPVITLEDKQIALKKIAIDSLLRVKRKSEDTIKICDYKIQMLQIEIGLLEEKKKNKTFILVK